RALRSRAGSRPPATPLRCGTIRTTVDEFAQLTSKRRTPGQTSNRLILVGLVVVVAAILIFSSMFTVDQGYRGVVLRLGAFERIAQPGLGCKMPRVDKVVMVRVQTSSKVYDRMETYSRDQQLAELRVSVTYRLVPEMVHEVYAQFGSEDGVVSR